MRLLKTIKTLERTESNNGAVKQAYSKKISIVLIILVVLNLILVIWCIFYNQKHANIPAFEKPNAEVDNNVSVDDATYDLGDLKQVENIYVCGTGCHSDYSVVLNASKVEKDYRHFSATDNYSCTIKEDVWIELASRFEGSLEEGLIDTGIESSVREGLRNGCDFPYGGPRCFRISTSTGEYKVAIAKGDTYDTRIACSKPEGGCEHLPDRDFRFNNNEFSVYLIQLFGVLDDPSEVCESDTIVLEKST